MTVLKCVASLREQHPGEISKFRCLIHPFYSVRASIGDKEFLLEMGNLFTVAQVLELGKIDIV